MIQLQNYSFWRQTTITHSNQNKPVVCCNLFVIIQIKLVLIITEEVKTKIANIMLIMIIIMYLVFITLFSNISAILLCGFLIDKSRLNT